MTRRCGVWAREEEQAVLRPDETRMLSFPRQPVPRARPSPWATDTGTQAVAGAGAPVF